MAPDETTVRVCLLKVQWKENGRERSREIRHYQWINWPDRGVPPCRLTSMVFKLPTNSFRNWIPIKNLIKCNFNRSFYQIFVVPRNQLWYTALLVLVGPVQL